MKKLLTVEQAAQILCLTTSSIYMRIARGQIPHIRLGPRTVRFDEDELLAWVQGNKVDHVAQNDE